MLLYRTDRGLARGDGNVVEILDLPHRNVAELLAEGGNLVRKARVVERLSVAQVTLLAPVERCGRIILNGLNYLGHVREGGMRLPETPAFLDIGDAGLCAPESGIILPRGASDMVDYEGELVLIVTRAGANIPASRAWEHIGGVTIGNDLSARDLQRAGVEDGRLVHLDVIRRGKSFPTFKPIGPAVLATDDLAHPIDLRMTTHVNGVLRQDARTSEMVFAIPTVVEHVSRSFTLEVGDLIFTGTPPGTGSATGRYLRAGDDIEIGIEGIGTLRNKVLGVSID